MDRRLRVSVKTAEDVAKRCPNQGQGRAKGGPREGKGENGPVGAQKLVRQDRKLEIRIEADTKEKEREK